MKLVTQAEFAKLRGVNKSTVTRWIQNGRMATEPNGLIDPERAAALLAATESPLPHHQARKAQFDEAREWGSQGGAEKIAPAAPQREATGNATPAESLPALEKLGAALKLETYKLQKAKAERENIALDKEAGALVERAEVELVIADFGATLRGLLEGLPDRLAAAIARHRGDVTAIHAEIEGVATDLLAEMGEHMKRKMGDA